MNDAAGEKALQIGESNRQAIAVLADKFEAQNRITLQMCESNGRAIAALADKVRENQQTELDLIKANSQTLSDLITSLSQMQASQSTMTQMLADKQDILRDFREIINTILERTERYQTESSHQLELLARDIKTLHDDFLAIQKDTMAILRELAERKPEAN
jgi:flagellar hook-basal body complex protein FliE